MIVGDRVNYNGVAAVVRKVDPHWGTVHIRMIGDDRTFAVDSSHLTPIEREDYCGQCGQVGCAHDGLVR